MTKEQSKAHWWIVENHPDFRIEPPKKYFEICDIVYNALNQGQSLPIDSVVVPKGTLPYPYKHQLKRIDQLNQTQTDLKQQLQILRHFANKLGLYDASDYLKEK